MKVLKIYNHNRRDCECNLKCENCGNIEIEVSAYNDDNYWNNIIPKQKCEKCGKSTNDLGAKIEQSVQTRYPEELQV